LKWGFAQLPLEFTPQIADPELKALGIHAEMRDGAYNYVALSQELQELARINDQPGYLQIIRDIGKVDFFFFCYFVLDLPINHPFLMARAFDVQKKHTLCIDLWAREHWKSSLLTYALPIWELIQNREDRICIFSHTRSMAKSHMLKIKTALEKNLVLLHAFEDIFYLNPEKEAEKWSLDEGLYVKRKGNYGEGSVESWGLVDSQPTGKHFSIMIFDDIIDLKGVNTPDQIKKASTAYKMALNLGTRNNKRRIIGTRYSNSDTYSEIMKNRYWTVRIFPGEVDEEGKSKLGGRPVYLTRKELDDKFAEQGEWVYSSQILQNPVAASEQKFQEHWIKYHSKQKPYLNLYITVDPASAKKRSSDYTVMCVCGVDSLRNFWLVDMIRDKLDLGERWEKLRDLVVKYSIDCVGYERYGMSADIEYHNMKMEEEGIFFSLIELGGNVSKYDRIKRLQPLFQKGKFLLPRTLPYTDTRGITHDLIHEFIEEEYKAFPYSKHDDCMDAMARITDGAMGVIFPTRQDPSAVQVLIDDPLNLGEHSEGGTWMAM